MEPTEPKVVMEAAVDCVPPSPGRARQTSLISLSSSSRARGTMSSRLSAQTINTLSSRCNHIHIDVTISPGMTRIGGERTYDEGGTLLLVGGGQHVHGVEHLDAGVHIDVYRILLRADAGETGVHGGGADFDGDDGVEEAAGVLEGGELGVFVGEEAEERRGGGRDGGGGRAGGDAEADARGDVFGRGFEPGVALCLLEDVVQDGVVGVVVHCGRHAGRAGRWPTGSWTDYG